MGKIYTDMNDFEEAQEKEFRDKVIEVNNIYCSTEVTTLDGEWTLEDLKDDVYSEAKKILTPDSKWVKEASSRALYNKELVLVQYMAEHISEQYDLIEVYNKAYAKHVNDVNRLFGIHYFDEEINKLIVKALKDNLVTN